ncbi:MAG TPA: AAA family ATPase [Acidimicrobiales bacterium]|nr:AAA family ATPase [Acidimicrobiales bacterium]
MAGEGILSITPANEPAGSEQVADDAATEAGGARAGSASPPEELVPEASLATPTSTAAAMSTATADPEAGEPPSPGASPAVLERPLKAPGSRPGTGGGKDAIPAGLAELGDTDVEAGDYVPRPLPRVMAVANQKGGVGKTTTAVNLGAALAELGYRVLIVDLDPQANATTGVGIDARSFDVSMYDVLMRDEKIEDAVEPTSMKNLFIAPSTIDLAGAEIELVPSFSRELKLRRALEPIADDFDFTLVDCPPSLGLITVNGLAAAAEVLVPIQCEYYALEGLGQLLRNVQLVKSNLNERLELTTIVLTMYDGRTKLAEQVAEEVRSHFGNKVCKNIIPRTVRISEAPSFGQPITAFDPSSRGAIAYRELAREVSGGAS